MASISREPNGRRSVQFMAPDGKRKSIRLGKVSHRLADEVRVKVEQFAAGLTTGRTPDNEALQWAAKIGDALHAKLAAVGLVVPRTPPEPPNPPPALGSFLESYIAGRTDVKPRTKINLDAARRRLVEFFGS